MLIFATQHETQRAAEADGDVSSFTGLPVFDLVKRRDTPHPKEISLSLICGITTEGLKKEVGPALPNSPAEGDRSSHMWLCCETQGSAGCGDSSFPIEQICYSSSYV